MHCYFSIFLVLPLQFRLIKYRFWNICVYITSGAPENVGKIQRTRNNIIYKYSLYQTSRYPWSRIFQEVGPFLVTRPVDIDRQPPCFLLVSHRWLPLSRRLQTSFCYYCAIFSAKKKKTNKQQQRILWLVPTANVWARVISLAPV